MITLIAELPWWVPGSLALVGIVLLVSGNNRLEPRLKYAGGGLLGLAVVLFLLSYVLESDRQQVERRTRQLVAAVGGGDWETARQLMHPDLQLGHWRGRDLILDDVRTLAERYQLERARVTQMEEVNDPDPLIELRIRVSADGAGYNSVPSSWLLEWVRTDDGWQVLHITPEGLPFAMLDGRSLIEQYFRSRPGR